MALAGLWAEARRFWQSKEDYCREQEDHQWEQVGPEAAAMKTVVDSRRIVSGAGTIV